MTPSPAPSYLLPSEPSELERIQLQARVWEPAGRTLLAQLPDGTGRRALDIGCGAMGWLRLLSHWVGSAGRVVGSDYDANMLDVARSFVAAEGLTNVELVEDDIFATHLPPHSFDLVHSRFQITPLGRPNEQLTIYCKLLKPGGWLVIEDPDAASWRLNPDAPATSRLIALIVDGFRSAGGNFNAGRQLPALFRSIGIEPRVDAHVISLPPGHPYLRVPLSFASSMRPRLESLIGRAELDELVRAVEMELNSDGTWGTTFTLIQAFAPVR